MEIFEIPFHFQRERISPRLQHDLGHRIELSKSRLNVVRKESAILLRVLLGKKIFSFFLSRIELLYMLV